MGFLSSSIATLLSRWGINPFSNSICVHHFSAYRWRWISTFTTSVVTTLLKNTLKKVRFYWEIERVYSVTVSKVVTTAVTEMEIHLHLGAENSSTQIVLVINQCEFNPFKMFLSELRSNMCDPTDEILIKIEFNFQFQYLLKFCGQLTWTYTRKIFRA
jgi:hypothetical protein